MLFSILTPLLIYSIGTYLKKYNILFYICIIVITLLCVYYSFAFINKNDNRIMSKLKKMKYQSKIILVDTTRKKSFSKFKNENFLSGSNIENLSFVIRLGKIFKIKKKILATSNNNSFGIIWRINNFKPRICCSSIYLYNILK